MENEMQAQPINIEENCNEFYNQIQDEIELDLARIKKSVSIVKGLTMTAAEIEFETATLYHAHAELLEKIKELENMNKISEEDIRNAHVVPNK